MRFPSMTALRALDAVARTGSVSVAARELNLTRSAISHQIKSLEQTLGFALTERTGRNIRITWQGERYARDIHGLLANILEAGQRFDGQRSAGACVSAARRALPPIGCARISPTSRPFIHRSNCT